MLTLKNALLRTEIAVTTELFPEDVLEGFASAKAQTLTIKHSAALALLRSGQDSHIGAATLCNPGGRRECKP